MRSGSPSNLGLVNYYRRRAREYERIYEKPERQADLAALRAWVQHELTGHEVLEIACGTGYWTQVCATHALSVLAVDLAEETLEIALAKEYPFGKVRFGKADAYQLEDVPGPFTAGLAGFWWSHIPCERMGDFLEGWHRRLGPGTRVVVFDNRYVEGSSTAISRTDAFGNTYQQRTLEGGSAYEVIKNFPSPCELLKTIQGIALEPKIQEFPYYWCLSYRVTGTA